MSDKYGDSYGEQFRKYEDRIAELEDERNDYRDRYESLKGEYAKLEEELVEADNATDCFNRQEEIIEKAKDILKRMCKYLIPDPQWNKKEKAEIVELLQKAEQFIKE